MKALFVHDCRFVQMESGVFSNHFPYETFGRYLTVFDELTVVGRRDWTDREKSSSLRTSSGPGVSFIFLPNLSSPRAFMGPRRQAAIALRRLIDAHDIIIFRLPSELGLLAASVARHHGRDHVVELVGCCWDALRNHGTALGRIYAPVQFMRVRHAVRCARFVSYVTERFLQHRYPPGPSSLTTSISDVEIPAADENASITPDRVIATRDGRTTVGVIGSMFVPYKGIDIGIKAIGKLVAMRQDVELRVLGGGNALPYADLAKSLGISDRVIFDGTLPAGEAVFSWLDEIDIYIQPSRQEGLPRALIEAMSRECPAVGSAVGGIPELLPEEFVFKPRASDQLAKILDRMINSASIRAKASWRNYERAQDYRSDILNARRRKFFLDIAHDSRFRTH